MTRRGRLNRDVVIETAQAMVDADGWQHLTVTALAKKLGVQGPSLYNHVEGLDGVLSELQVRAHAELGQRLQRAVMGKVGPAALEALALAFYEFAMEHPGLYDLAMMAPFDRARVVDASEASGAALGAVVTSFGVTEPSPELFMSCVATFHGVVSLARTGLFGGSVDPTVAYRRAIALVTLMLEGERQAASPRRRR